MLRPWILVILVAIHADGAGAQEKPPIPHVLLPEIVMAEARDRGEHVSVIFFVPQYIPVEQTVTLERDGKIIVMTDSFVQRELCEIWLKADGKEIKSFGVDGKPIDPKELPKRLGMQAEVALFFTNPEVDALVPDDLSGLNQDIIVFAGEFERFHRPFLPPGM